MEARQASRMVARRRHLVAPVTNAPQIERRWPAPHPEDAPLRDELARVRGWTAVGESEQYRGRLNSAFERHLCSFFVCYARRAHCELALDVLASVVSRAEESANR